QIVRPRWMRDGASCDSLPWSGDPRSPLRPKEISVSAPGYRDTPIQPWSPGDPVDLAEAAEFLRLFHSEYPDAGPVEPRLRQVRAEIGATGTYVHSGPELTFGAKVAWRNASRCIGRLY